MKNNKIKIDYFTEKDTVQICGWRRVINEIRKNTKDTVNEKIISYRSNLKLPYSRYLTYLFLYPKIIKSKTREGSIKFLAHQELAYLYKLFNFKKSIIICHDIIPFLYPSSIVNKLYFLFCMENINKATVIISDSNSTKNDLINIFSCSPEKIHTIYPGVDEKFKQIKTNKVEIFNRYAIPTNSNHIIYVGSYAKNKNINGLIRFFGEVHRIIKDAILVIVNEKEKMPKKYTKLINNLGLKGMVHFTGYVNDKELINLYNCSDLLIYPSFYEGFGMPPLEAMACGCPVITSNTSSLPEVVENAGAMVNPNDYNKMANEAILLLQNREMRDAMINKGLKQAKKFRNNPSQKILDIYRELV